MTMQYEQRDATWECWFKVSEVEPLPTPSWLKPGTFLPTGAQVRFVHRDGAWKCLGVRLTGRKIKADGQPGNNEVKVDYPGSLNGWSGVPAPAWLSELVEVCAEQVSR
jgi:hypothetical protein